MRRSQRKQRSRSLEGKLQPLEAHERRIEGRERALEIALRQGEQAAAARDGGQRPRPVEPACQHLLPVELRSRLAELATRDQRLDRVRPEGIRRLVQRPQPQLVQQAGEMSAGGVEIAESEVQPAKRTVAEAGQGLALERLRECKSLACI